MLTHPPYSDAFPASLSCDMSCPDAETVVVTAAGEADLYTLPVLEEALCEAIGRGRPYVVVDLDQLSFMGATALGVLVDARRRLSATGGTLHVRCRTDLGRRLLAVTGLDDMLCESA